MIDRTTFILLDTKLNRHSLNALVGALETDRDLDPLELRLAANETQLGQCISETLSAGSKPIVGLSLATPQLGRIEGLMSRLARGPEVLWVAGGPHPSADPEGMLQRGFDIVVRGEGEGTLLDLLKAATAGRELAEVPGIAYRGPSGRAILTAPRLAVDLDRFPPFPLRRRRVVGPIEITRGCPFACGFCQTSHLLGARPRHRSVKAVARYASVIRQRNLRDVRVVTPNAFSYGSPDGRAVNLPALESLLAALRQTLGAEGRLYFGSFPSEVRPDHVTDAALELVTRYANNDNLVIGAQTGSERLLAHCGRQHGAADIIAAVSRTVAAGLKPVVDFMFGLPGETREDLQSTAEVMRELAALGAMIHAHTFIPLPQTRFAKEPAGKIHGHVRPLIKELMHQGSLFGF